MEHHPDLALREIFHFLFLEQLLRISDPKLYILKGGVNLRFFFGSPRYSEDMDLDVISGQVETLKKNCYKILNDMGFKRTLATYGISDLLINDPHKAKQTQTTQRFKLRLVTKQGLELPTKVEFSRRASKSESCEDIIKPEIAKQYFRLSYKCRHYPANIAIQQKVEALAGRIETQARDVFDLYILYLGGHWSSLTKFDKNLKEKALANLLTITSHQYKEQVTEYLSDTEKFKYEREWKNIKNIVALGLK